MSYKVKSPGKIGLSLQRIAVKEVATALAKIKKSESPGIVRATHAARKHLKKARAILRLLRSELGKRRFKAENICLRDAGRELRDLRDAHVLMNMLDALSERFFEGKPPALIKQARRLFSAHACECEERLTNGSGMGKTVAKLRAALIRYEGWKLQGFRWKETRNAFRRNYKLARKAGCAARAEPGVEHLHEWRKRSKDLWYQARLLRKISPEFMKEFAHELKVLTEILGEDHDLSVLRESLLARNQVLKQPQQLSALLKMLELRRAELTGAALALGQRLTEKSPKSFAAELDESRKAQRHEKRMTKKLAGRFTPVES